MLTKESTVLGCFFSFLLDGFLRTKLYRGDSICPWITSTGWEHQSLNSPGLVLVSGLTSVSCHECLLLVIFLLTHFFLGIPFLWKANKAPLIIWEAMRIQYPRDYINSHEYHKLTKYRFRPISTQTTRNHTNLSYSFTYTPYVPS